MTGGVHIHAHAAAPEPPAAAPRQLPPASRLFTGRAQDLAELDSDWRAAVERGTGALLVLSGTAGVGKTALAVAWLNHRAADFPDGHLYADLGGYSRTGPVAPQDVLAAFLRALGVAPDQVPTQFAERAALLRTTTYGRRVGVLLDNAVSAAQVRVLALASSGCATVVTTRGMLTGLTLDGASFHRLERWRDQTAVAFMRGVLGEARVDAEPEAALTVARLCGGLPLAVAIASAKLTARPRWTIARLARALDSDTQRLEELAVDADAGVTGALDGSYEALQAEEALLYRLLGRCPTPWFDLDSIAALLGGSTEDAEQRADALVDANMLEDLGQRYRFHDLVRLHAAGLSTASADSAGRADRADLAGRVDRADPADPADPAYSADLADPADPAYSADLVEEATALARFFDFYLATATEAEALVTPSHRFLERDYHSSPPPHRGFASESEALDWLDAQRPNLMAVLRYCAEHDRPRLVWQLADAMWPLFLRRRLADDRLEAQSLALAAVRRDANPRAEGNALTNLAGTTASAGRLQDSMRYTEQAIELYERIGDERGLAQACDRLAKSCLATGDLDRAEQLFSRALELRVRVGYQRGVYLTHQGLGRVAADRGDLARAARHLRRSYRGLAVLGDRYDAAWSLAQWARTSARRGQEGFALRLAGRALASMRELGSAFGQGGVLEIEGEIHEAGGRLEAAAERYAQAADCFASVDPLGGARVRARLAALDLAPPPTPETEPE